jgi:hypothetical protein
VDWQQERVLGDDLVAIEIEGDELSGLGSTLVLGAQGLLVGAEGSGRIHAFDLSGQELWCASGAPGLGMRLGWTDEGAWSWQRGTGFRFFSDTGELISEEIETDATAVDRCPDGSFEAVFGPGAALSCSESGLLWTECADGACDVLEDGEVIAQTSPGSDVAWVDGQSCWGDVEFETPDAAGSAQCADGWSVQGIQGEHLGSSMQAGRVGGQFSKWSIPARARVLDKAGGDIWTVDRAAERSRLSLAEHEGSWAIGVPGYIGHGAQEGRVFLLIGEPGS